MAIYWSFLLERSVGDVAVDAILDVAAWCGSKLYNRIAVPYMRTDLARNEIVSIFCEQTQEPNDVLIMLDSDHAHPHYVVERLASHKPEHGVVGALYFRRSRPHDPLFFVVDETGQLKAPAVWERGKLYECDVVATGAIAIRRWVFDHLPSRSAGGPCFRYAYPAPSFIQSEDVFFGLLCHGAGIKHYCDTGLITPHLTVQGVDHQSWIDQMRGADAPKEEE